MNIIKKENIKIQGKKQGGRTRKKNKIEGKIYKNIQKHKKQQK